VQPLAEAIFYFAGRQVAVDFALAHEAYLPSFFAHYQHDGVGSFGEAQGGTVAQT
jgi:hypothetical protein